MSKAQERGRVIAAIAEPGSDARRAYKAVAKQNGDDTHSALIPRRGQIIIGSRSLIAHLREKTRVRHILTGKNGKLDVV